MDNRAIGSALKLAPLVLVAGLFTGCRLDAESLQVDGSFDRSLSVSGPIDVDVVSRSGRIQIQPGPADSVRIVGHIRASGGHWFGASAEQRVRALEATPPIEQNGNVVKIGEDWNTILGSNLSISYEITAPVDTRLRTSSRSGDQQIGAIRGPVTATSRSGVIVIERVGGNVDVETRSGGVDVNGQTAAVRASSRSGQVTIDGEPSEAWTVVTRSGDVDVQLTANAGAQLDLQTSSGSIDASHPVQMSEARSRKRLQGTLGRGGSRLEVTTRSGQIRIR